MLDWLFDMNAVIRWLLIYGGSALLAFATLFSLLWIADKARSWWRKG